MALSAILNALYYVELTYTAATQAYTAYNKVKELQTNPSPTLTNYADCGASCVSALLSNASLGLSIQKDFTC